VDRKPCSVLAAEAVKDARITFSNQYVQDLLDQASKISYFFDEKARYHIEPKDKMKEEGIPSPGLWDTVCMAFLESAHYISSADYDSAQSCLDTARRAAEDAFAGA
jgi:hypothetical protein